MHKLFSVSFFWKGERKHITSFCDHWPQNDLDASGLAFIAIKTWFENEKQAIPVVIRNVELVANGESYNWPNLPL